MSRKKKRGPKPDLSRAAAGQAPAPVSSSAAVPSGSGGASSEGPRRLDLGIALLLVVATVAVYWPVHAYDFIPFDDPDYVKANAPVLAGLTAESVRWAFTTTLGSFWIPLVWLSFMVDTELYGTGPGGYHITNVILHVACTLIVFEALRRGTGRRWPSAFVAALFALHPLHVESVVWITERKDTLSTFFLFLGLWAWGAYGRRPRARWYIATFVCMACGLMAKPMLVTVPALLLLLDLWPLGRFGSATLRRLAVEKVPFALLGIFPAYIAMATGGHLDYDPQLGVAEMLARIGHALESCFVYLWRMVWPAGLAVLYPEHLAPPPPWRVGIATLALGGTTAFTLRELPRRPYLAAGWLFYLVSLVPVSGIVKTGHYATADRFTYVPLLGIFVLVAWGAADLLTTSRARRLAGALAVAVLAAFAAAARHQLGFWRDGVTLFERTIAVTGPNFVMQYLLGLAYAEQGRRDEAIERIGESLRIRPDYAHAHGSLGLLLLERGEAEKAIEHLKIAVRLDPAETHARVNLGNVLVQQGRHDEAIAHYTDALRADPRFVPALTGYGRALAELGRLDEAIAQYRAALAIDGSNAQAHNNLANALAARGAADEALEHYAAAVRVRPDHHAARVNLALFHAERGQFAQAVEQFEAALRIRPGDARVHGDAGNALAAQGKLQEAVAHYQEAIRLDPRNAAHRNNLANALAMLGRSEEAIPHYREAIRLEPSYAEAYFNLGTVLAGSGRTIEAVSLFEETLRLDPGSAAAHTRLGSTLRALGRADEARAHLEAALRIDPNDAEARRQLREIEGVR